MKNRARVATTCAWVLFVGACDQSDWDHELDDEEDLRLMDEAEDEPAEPVNDSDRPVRAAPEADAEANADGDGTADPGSKGHARPGSAADSYAAGADGDPSTSVPVHEYVGDCCAANGSPGCDDPDCTWAVCKYDPFCCDVQWDAICAAEALVEPACQGLGGSCGGPECVEEDIDSQMGWVVARGKTLLEDTTLPPSCGAASGSPDHVVEFTAPFSGTYHFNTFGSYYDTVLAAFSSCDHGSELACNDDEGHWTLQSKLSLDLQAGDTILLSVSGFNGQSGLYVLNILLDGFEGDCCAAHDTPGCEDPSCTAAICNFDGFCCGNHWDGLCAAEASVAEECKGVGSCPGW